METTPDSKGAPASLQTNAANLAVSCSKEPNEISGKRHGVAHAATIQRAKDSANDNAHDTATHDAHGRASRHMHDSTSADAHTVQDGAAHGAAARLALAITNIDGRFAVNGSYGSSEVYVNRGRGSHEEEGRIGEEGAHSRDIGNSGGGRGEGGRVKWAVTATVLYESRECVVLVEADDDIERGIAAIRLAKSHLKARRTGVYIYTYMYNTHTNIYIYIHIYMYIYTQCIYHVCL